MPNGIQNEFDVGFVVWDFVVSDKLDLSFLNS
jgi:hypothetical protein